MTITIAFSTPQIPVRTNSTAKTSSLTTGSFTSRRYISPYHVSATLPSFCMNTAPKPSSSPPSQTDDTDLIELEENGVEGKSRTEDELTTRVRKELAADGVNFDDLLDASSALKLTREQDELMSGLEQLTPGSEEFTKKQERLEQVQLELKKVRRQVMQPFLKKVFFVQAIVFALAGGVLSADPDVPLVGQAFGFWMVWLFTIPALRARKGTARWEKSALNISFIMTPLINVLLPVFTKQCIVIWSADVVVLLACYAYYFRKAINDVDNETDVEQAKIKGLLKYLDWGSWR